MKQGPIALIDEDMPVVVLAPRDRLYEKTVSNLMEVKARGAPVIAFVTAGGRGGGLAARPGVPGPGVRPPRPPRLFSRAVSLPGGHLPGVWGAARGSTPA